MTLSYEICKELKEAGYPQKRESCIGYAKEDGAMWMAQHRNDVLYLPTLSELISECGDEIISLHFKSSGRSWVEYFGATTVLKTKLYSTPEEAVARLYLALNR